MQTRLRVGLSNQREHKFRHNFNATIDPVSYCRTKAIESFEQFLLQCPNHTHYRSSLFDNLRQNGISILPFSNSYLIKIPLFGSNKFHLTSNNKIISGVINFII